MAGPFKSRADLLAAALDDAAATFRDAVISPMDGLPAGPSRFRTLIDSWIDYLVDCPFPGGCFVTAASSELDGRPGSLRDQLTEFTTSWRTFLRTETRAIRPESNDAEVNRIVLTLVGIAMATNEELQLLSGGTDAAETARLAMRCAAGLA